MPQATRPPLTPECEAIRAAVNALSDTDRKALNSWLWSDQMHRNDARHQANAEAFESEQRARDRDRRAAARGQMRLEDAA